MQPLFDYASIAASGETSSYDFAYFYEEINLEDEDADDELQKYTPYYGRNVVWLGKEGRMIRCKPEYTSPMPGNIFDPDKLKAIAEYITVAPYDLNHKVVFTCCVLADPSIIDIDDIVETQVAASQGRLEEMYIDRPFTTGDDELDEYLVREYEGELEDYYDEDEIAEFEGLLKEAIENNEGDLGEYWITIRDGNHRTFGAFAAGERYVYALVLKNSLIGINPDDLE